MIAARFVAVLAIGVDVGRITETGEDLVPAGRTSTLGVIGCSLLASDISRTTVVGLAGAAAGRRGGRDHLAARARRAGEALSLVPGRALPNGGGAGVHGAHGHRVLVRTSRVPLYPSS
jgi:hypothetical protein